MPNLYRCENQQLSEKRGEEKSSPQKKKKIDFKHYQKNTINSLNEVEHFLRNFNSFTKYIKLYKILK